MITILLHRWNEHRTWPRERLLLVKNYYSSVNVNIIIVCLVAVKTWEYNTTTMYGCVHSFTPIIIAISYHCRFPKSRLHYNNYIILSAWNVYYPCGSVKALSHNSIMLFFIFIFKHFISSNFKSYIYIMCLLSIDITIVVPSTAMTIIIKIYTIVCIYFCKLVYNRLRLW